MSGLVYLLANPQESILLTKGKKRKVQFVCPPELLNPEFKPAAQMMSRFGEDADEQVYVKQIDPPDLTEILVLPRDAAFSNFNPVHSEIAGKLMEMFLRAKDKDELLSLAIYCRERVNPYLFQYSFSVAIKHRSDTKNITLPSIVTTFPDRFFNSKVLGKAREESSVVPEGKRKPIEIPVHFTASDKEKEHRVFYYREDIGLNLHHWNWHQVYPNRGPREVVDKDRRGELFYYMHEQMIARYNFERLCNDLDICQPIVDFSAPLEQGYFSKLDQSLTGRSYPGRVPNLVLTDVHREGAGQPPPVAVDDIERWRGAILAAIESGYATDKEMRKIPLDEQKGIDILGNMVEASLLSVNSQMYGNLHDMGHLMIAYLHDPDGRHLENVSVMGDLSTAIRDPLFFRWHTLVNNIFTKFKNTLPSYSIKQLDYSGIQVEHIQLQSQGEGPNVLRTFWSKATVNIANGLDFQNGSDLEVRFTHLQHTKFSYQINLINTTGLNKAGTCRIFMAPKYNREGRPWKFADQKIMFIELDKFKVIIPPGKSKISRESSSSSVTIPFEQTYRDLTQVSEKEIKDIQFCGCGWPDNLLVPKGTPTGFPAELFVMISDYEHDKIEQDTKATGDCKDAYSYCGVKDALYPDRRSMGYPFDRMPRAGVENLYQFLTPNMNVCDVKIVFTDKVMLKGK